jgi:nucleoside-diphosphate-sugar epimerase
MTDQLDAENVAGFVHLAFLTRDKVETYGTKDYTFRNLEITSRAIELIEQLKPSWIATVSSGAVLSSPGGPLENNLERNPYGFTKRIEETMLRQVAQQIDAHLSIGRLWGAMGSFMPVNRAYAVSDFIVQAVTTGSISIKADRQVWRRYCDAGEFMRILISSAYLFELTEFDSGGKLTELGPLAESILRLAGYSKLSVNRNAPTEVDDTYYPDGNSYNLLLNNLGITPSDFNASLRALFNNQIKHVGK